MGQCSITPTYDSRGNVASAGSTSYSYDSTNRLTAGGGENYYYDPAGRLFAHANVSAGYTYALNSGDTMIGEYSSAGAVLNRYVHGPGIDEPLVWYEGSGTSDRHYLHADERGSVIATSNGSGNVTNVNAYDEYGIPAASNSGRFQYTGQQWLAELGMQYSRARIYSPSMGRFMQTDPIRYFGGMNLYGYVLNDPVNRVDPFGLSPGDCRDYEVWMYRIIHQVWSPGGIGPGKIVEKYPEMNQICDTPQTSPSPWGPDNGPGDGDGGGEASEDQQRRRPPTEEERRQCATMWAAIVMGAYVVHFESMEIALAATARGAASGGRVGRLGGGWGMVIGAGFGALIGYATYRSQAETQAFGYCRSVGVIQ